MVVTKLDGMIGDRGVNAVLIAVADNNLELEVVREEIVMERLKWHEHVIHTLAKVSSAIKCAF